MDSQRVANFNDFYLYSLDGVSAAWIVTTLGPTMMRKFLTWWTTENGDMKLQQIENVGLKCETNKTCGLPIVSHY